jgi:flagellin
MALAIATNNAALNAAASASSVNRDMEQSMARLSSGKRINSASDDAAGVAIASRLSAEIRGTDQAIRNSLDGQALIDTAEGAHKEIENILQRMREIAVQSANDTNNAQDRTNLQAEMDAMITEIDRIAETTTWAGTNLMKANDSVFEFQVGSATETANQIKVTIGGMTASDLSLKGSSGLAAADFSISQHTANTAAGGHDVASLSLTKLTESVTTTDQFDIAHTAAQTGAGSANTAATLTLNGKTVTLGGVAQTDVSAINTAFGDFGVVASVKTGYNTTTNASRTGTAAAAYITLTVPQASATGGISVEDTTTGAGDADANSRAAIGKVDTAIKNVNIQRSELGAVSNRLNHTVNNLTNISSNLSAARGGIEDADFAVETTNLAKNQILQQASTAMLAQANASQQNVLALLRI